MDEGMEHESTDDGWEDTQGRESSIQALLYTGVYIFRENHFSLPEVRISKIH